MRILGARIFSKIFGAKLNFSTEVNYLELFTEIKNRRMRILSAGVFSKSFGGKIGEIWTAVTRGKPRPKH